MPITINTPSVFWEGALRLPFAPGPKASAKRELNGVRYIKKFIQFKESHEVWECSLRDTLKRGNSVFFEGSCAWVSTGIGFGGGSKVSTLSYYGCNIKKFHRGLFF